MTTMTQHQDTRLDDRAFKAPTQVAGPDWLRPVQDYEDSVELQRALRHAIRGIVRSAFELKERNDAG